MGYFTFSDERVTLPRARIYEKNSAFPSEKLAKNLLVRTNLNFSELFQQLMNCRITGIRLYFASLSGADDATF